MLLTSIGCSSMFLKPGTVHLPELPAQRSTIGVHVALCDLVDARPPSEGRTLAPVRTFGGTLALGIPAIGIVFTKEKTSGVESYGDEFRRYVSPKNKNDLGDLDVLDAHLAALVKRVTGTRVERDCGSFSLDAVDGAADDAEGPSLVIIPVLDQLYMAGLSSMNSFLMAGGSSSQTGPNTKTITTDGVGKTLSSGGTPSFSNARLRFVLLRTDGDKVLAHRTVYGAGSARGGSYPKEIGQALSESMTRLSAGLADALADPTFVARR